MSGIGNPYSPYLDPQISLKKRESREITTCVGAITPFFRVVSGSNVAINHFDGWFEGPVDLLTLTPFLFRPKPPGLLTGIQAQQGLWAIQIRGKSIREGHHLRFVRTRFGDFMLPNQSWAVWELKISPPDQWTGKFSVLTDKATNPTKKEQLHR